LNFRRYEGQLLQSTFKIVGETRIASIDEREHHDPLICTNLKPEKLSGEILMSFKKSDNKKTEATPSGVIRWPAILGCLY
jgi:hypothetical protein